MSSATTYEFCVDTYFSFYWICIQQWYCWVSVCVQNWLSTGNLCVGAGIELSCSDLCGKCFYPLSHIYISTGSKDRNFNFFLPFSFPFGILRQGIMQPRLTFYYVAVVDYEFLVLFPLPPKCGIVSVPDHTRLRAWILHTLVCTCSRVCPSPRAGIHTRDHHRVLHSPGLIFYLF